jgi:hypothetical protein
MLNTNEVENLVYAKQLLSSPGLAAKITNYIGKPIEGGLKMLPDSAQSVVATASEKAINAAATIAFATMDSRATGSEASNKWHKLMAAMCGAAGGAGGLPALALELPVSTSIMMRSIADIARSEQASLSDAGTRVECISVFALGGRTQDDDAAENGYYAVRLAMARSVSEATQYLATVGAAEAGSPILARLISQIAARFGIQVSQKVAAQMIPVLGAAGGAIVNTLFIAHFQDMARGHFIIKRLEAKHGMQPIQIAYKGLS